LHKNQNSFAYGQCNTRQLRERVDGLQSLIDAGYLIHAAYVAMSNISEQDE
jgi:hypothetical protein